MDTFLKLSPAEIIHFTVNRSAYSRDRLIREVLLANPGILSDRQSLGHALSAVIEERQDDERLDSESPGRPFQLHDELKTGSNGGILDFEASDTDLREYWGGNGQRALDWEVSEKPQLRLRVVMNKGRLEP